MLFSGTLRVNLDPFDSHTVDRTLLFKSNLNMTRFKNNVVILMT